ncbi:YdcF family protein [Microcoleus sp. FACHB-SPT15]|uniref:YdcF family protein n=1 Tax=Microcoleus sp. FACHB-SPT15 TaxID=2692830 RepID=UPI00177B5F10|nr:YdcF family protein [Microcoleus sp. FACHB-SPT15]MBD1809545.1 YdcF family protein [Microcoleus sp. FACHB-SPT15]
MFLLLTQVLLWLLLTVILYQLLLKVIPRAYLTLIGGLFLFAIIVLAFFFPNDRLVSAAWNILAFPLKPVGASILLLIIALRQGLGKSRNLVSAALLILLVSSTPILANQLAQRTELGAIQAEQRRQELCQGVCPADVTPTGTAPVGAIVVLGRGTTQANLPYRTQIQLTDTGDRILYAAQLYREQVAAGTRPLVIVSAGPRADLQGNQDQTTEANDIATLLTQLGVPREQIVVEPRGIDLRSSAIEVNNILRSRQLGNSRVLLVTSGLNSRRARLTFADVGINVISRPTDFVGFQAGATPRLRLRIESFLPTVEALTVTTRIVEEFLTSLYYYLRGWLAPVII